MFFQPWAPVDARGAGLIGLAALFMAVAFITSVVMMRVGEIGFVSPFRYAGLVWALILGFVLFGDWPDALTLTGAGIVVATGLFTLYRERKLAAERRATRGPGKG